MVVRIVCVSVALAGSVGCGGSSEKKTGGPTGSGMSATATVTPTMGGTVEVEGATLEVPPGAVPDDVEITVTSTTERPTGFSSWASPVYQFGPDGLVFLAPVQVTLSFTGDPVAPTVMWSLPQGGFENRGGTVSGRDITTTVLHFSQGVVVPAPGPNDPDAGTFIPPDTGRPGADGGNPGPDGGGGTPDGGGTPGDGGVTPPDGGVSFDSGVTPDGGGIPDGGISFDGGVTPDGGPPPPPPGDAGTGPDGGPPPPPPGDAGTAPDGGGPPPPPPGDAGTAPDGGPSSDGGITPPPPPPDGGTEPPKP